MNNAVKIFGLEINVGRTPMDLEKVDKLILKTSKDIQRAKMDWLEYSQTLTSLQGHALILQFMKEFEAKAKTTTAARRTMTAEEKVAARTIRESAKVQEMQVLAEKSRIGSIRQLEAEISKLNILWKALSKEERTKTASGRAMTSQLTALRKEMRETKVAAGDFSGNIGNYMSAIYNGITSKFALISGVVMGLKRLVTGIFQPFQDLEYRMAMVKAVSGATSEEFAALEQNARELGASTEYTATEVAGLQLAYARMGFVPGQIMQITGATLDLATATGEDLAKSADVVGTTLKGFNLTADQTQRVVDVMAKSFNASSLQLDSFYEAMKYVAPIATVANVSLEETSAMLGVLADRGIRGSQAGTALRRIFTEMAKEGGSVSERLEQLSKQGLTLGGAMDEVGRYAMTALTVLAGSKGGVDELTGALYNAEGAAKATADGIRDTMKIDIDVFFSAIKEKLISVGKSLAPLATWVIHLGTTVVTNLKNVAGTIVTYTVAIKAASILKAAWNVVTKQTIIYETAFGKSLMVNMVQLRTATASTQLLAAAKLLLTGQVRAASIAFGMFNKTLLKNPFGVIAVVLASVISYFAFFRKETDSTSQAYSDCADSIAKDKQAIDELKSALDASEDGSVKRRDLINEINEKYKDYLPQLLTEKSSYDDIKAALETVNTKLEENIRLKYASKIADEETQKIIDAENILIEELKNRWDKLHRDQQMSVETELQIIEKAREYSSSIQQLTRDANNGVEGARHELAETMDQFYIEMSDKFGLAGSKMVGIALTAQYNIGRATSRLGQAEAVIEDDPKKKTTPTPTPTPDPKDKGEWSLSKDKDHNRQLLALKEQLHSGEISSEEQYQKQVLQLEIDTLTKRIALNKDEGKTILKLKSDLWDKQNQQKKSEQKANETYAANRKAQDEKELKYDNDHIDAGIAAMEDGVDKKIKLNEQATKKAQESALKEYQTEVDKLDKQIKANEGDAAKVAQIEAQKANVKTAYDRKQTDITAAGTDARVKILKDATEKELEEYGKLPDKAAEAERQITENKRREVNERLKLAQKETEESIAQAKNQYKASESTADITIGAKGRKRNVAHLQNEVQLHQDVAQAYQKELNGIIAGGDDAIAQHKARYDELIVLIGQEQTAATNLGKGKTAGGERKSIWTQFTEMSDEDIVQLRQQAADLAGQIGNAMIDAQKQASQRRLNNEKKAIDAQYKTEAKLLDSKRDKGLISEKQYQKELEKLEAEKAKKEEEVERAAFEREKKHNIAQAWINVAVGIAKIWATYGSNLFTMPVAIAQTAVLTAQGIIQTGFIASQKYEQGGLIPLSDGMGVVKGRSHSQGGHQIYIDGRPIGEIEGDELLAIVNKHDTRRIGALSAANSVHGRKFAQGGMISPTGFLINHVAPSAGFAALRGQSQAELYKQQEADRQQRETTTQLLLANIEAINKRIDTLKVVVVDRDITDMQKNTKKVEVKSSW